MEVTLKLKTLFLIDGMGGLSTGLTVGLILPLFPEHIGIPLGILYAMSFYGFMCGAYSLFWSFNKSVQTRHLRPIIFANAFYCLLSIGVMAYFFESLSIVGLGYFLIEKIIILIIILIEIKTHLYYARN